MTETVYDDRHQLVPKTGTCSPWAEIADIQQPDVEDLEQGMVNECLQIASDILFGLTAQRWPGTCQDTVRPCLRTLTADYGRPVRPPYPFGGPYGYWPAAGMSMWSPSMGFWMTNRTDRDGRNIIPEITLGAYPVTGIKEILVDGVALPEIDPGSGFRNWRIDDNAWLVRCANPVTNQNDGWPGSQRMDIDADQKDTWQVTYYYGTPPPTGGRIAAAIFGYQIALSRHPAKKDKCRLPTRVTQITRQGITAVVLDPMSFLKDGKVGLYEVDAWIESVNPGHLRRQATVSSPDIQRRVRRAGS